MIENPTFNRELIASETQAVIFDYDGLLVDSEELWSRSFKESFAAFGLDITPELYTSWAGRGLLIPWVINEYRLQVEVEDARTEVYKRMRQAIRQGVTPMPGAIEAVTRLSKRYPLAVASSSRTEFLNLGLAHLGITDKFRAIIGGDQISRGKPEPDIFLTAASLLSIDPTHCLVYEDSLHGLNAAKAAGMLCIAVPREGANWEDFKIADVISTNLNLTLQLFNLHD